MFSVNEVIEMAVQIERCGYTYYHEALTRKDISQEVLTLITQLRDEELKHEAFFKKLRDGHNWEEIKESEEWETVASYFKLIIESRIFSTPEAAIRKIQEAGDEKEILRNAVIFEKDTLLYFHTLKDLITDTATRSIIAQIIQEEIKHVMFINAKLRSLD